MLSLWKKWERSQDMETNTGLLSLHDEVESPHPEGPLLPSTRKSQKSSLSAGDSEELSS